MMGVHEAQKQMFSYAVDLDRRVRTDHPLRRVLAHVDFAFSRDLVAHTYGQNGKVSPDPVVLVKLMFLLFHDNVKSERELMRMLPERLDYLWFLGFGLDDVIPDHSVLSKARARWGRDVFEELFIHSVSQCVAAGLVEGHTLHMDGSLIDADASRDSVVKGDTALIARIREAYAAQERKLDESKPPSARSEVNAHVVSTTDVDAACVSRGPGSGTARPRYKHHRAVDDRCGVITAVVTTSGDVAEPSQVDALIDQHEVNTAAEVGAVVADRGYGTVETYCALIARGVQPHMPSFLPADHTLRGLFGRDEFRYDEKAAVYVCPVGQHLQPKRVHQRRQMTDYVADAKICAACSLKAQCTRSKLGRSIARHRCERDLQRALQISRSAPARANRRRRRFLMEGSFAQSANRHHFKRSRWRRHWRQQIQDWLICAVQNFALLCAATASGVPAKRPTVPSAGAGTATAEAVSWFCRHVARLRAQWRGFARLLPRLSRGCQKFCATFLSGSSRTLRWATGP